VIISYSGLGRGIARLYASALRTLRFTSVQVVDPVELVEEILPYDETDEVIFLVSGP